MSSFCEQDSGRMSSLWCNRFLVQSVSGTTRWTYDFSFCTRRWTYEFTLSTRQWTSEFVFAVQQYMQDCFGDSVEGHLTDLFPCSIGSTSGLPRLTRVEHASSVELCATQVLSGRPYDLVVGPPVVYTTSNAHRTHCERVLAELWRSGTFRTPGEAV